MKKIICLLLLTIFTGVTSMQAQDTILAREPAINAEGSTVSFSFQGDIWTVPFAGGEASRLTIHEGYESAPVWSPDGSSIAFKGARFGNTDIFTIPAGGGRSQRITYFSGNDELSDWTPDNRLLFASNRTFQQLEWDSELQQVSATGGTPSRLMDALGDMPVVSPNGRYIAFVRGSCRIAREQYDGPADKDIWIYDTKKKSFTEITDNSVNDYLPRWTDNETLHYIGASSGHYNIYTQKINADGSANGKAVARTTFKEDGVRYFDIAENGNIVLERKTDLYTLSGSSAKAQKLAITLSSDYRFDPVEHKNYSDNITEYEVSPSGKYTAMTIRGEIFIKENDKENKKAVNISDNPYRDQSPTWLNDSTLIFTSDRSGQYELYMAKSVDANKTNLFKTLKLRITPITDTKADEVNPQISPDGKKIMYRRGRGELITADISEAGSLTNQKILLNGWATPQGVNWSPDSKWLAYSLPNLNFNSEVYIHAADGSKDPVNITLHPRGDFSPVWSRDGSKIGFISNRNNGDNDLWFVWLSEEDWQKTKEDREEGYYFDHTPAKESQKDQKEDEKKKVEPVKIDFKDIHERLWQVTSLPGDEANLAISEDGNTFYFTAGDPATNGSDLFSVKFDRSETKQLTEGGQNPYSVALAPDGKQLYALKNGGLYQLNLSDAKLSPLPFNARMLVNHQKENAQIFEEAWSALNQGFYDPEFHGKDWAALKKKYKPWTLASSTSQDFRYMFNWMLGQLNASHMGLYGSNPEETQEEHTGLLGIAVKPVSKGVQVNHVVMNSPADRAQSKLVRGDVIKKVDGKPIAEGTNFYSYLINDVSDQILLEVENASGKTREVVIRPANSLNDELYEEWVDSREKLIDKYSNGRLGYIHIEGMNWPSFERFERELMASGHGKEGIVIDVRWNGGGWTTDMLLTVLNVRQHAYTVPRGATQNLDKDHQKFREYYPFGERLPLSWWTKPSVTIANESSYSNAEIFAHAFKTLGIGKLVGMPTFGAVISTGGMRLIDGSFVRMPFRAWYVKATDKNMENGPAYPDVTVNNAPNSKAKGEDPQLKKAVEVMLKQLGGE